MPLNPDDLLDDAFMQWCFAMQFWGGEMKGMNEFFLTPACSTSYALQIDADDQLSLGVLALYVPAFHSMAPDSAVLLRNQRDGNWLGLNAPNVSARPDDALALKVFFPIDAVKIEAFVGAAIKPSVLRLRTMVKRRMGRPALATGAPRFEIPLSYYGFSQGKKKAAPQVAPERRAARH